MGDKFTAFADLAPEGVDAFIFVFKNGRFTEASYQQISAFKEVAGHEAFKHTILVFTQCGSTTNAELQNRIERSDNEHLQKAAQLIPRILGVDSLSPDRCERDRNALLDSVQQLLKSNHGMKYDNSTLT